MNFQEFRNSAMGNNPPKEIGLALTALWWDSKGNWHKAHESAQQDEGPAGSWVHAYLHRKKGDLANAGYWYQRAGKSLIRGSFEQEWQEIVASLLTSS